MGKNLAFIVALFLFTSSYFGTIPREIRSNIDKVSKIEYVAEVENPDGTYEDYWQTPKETIKRGKGDCEDMAFYLLYLLRKEHIKSKIKFGYLNKITERKKLGHVWVEAKKNSIEYILDPSQCPLPLIIEKGQQDKDTYIPISSRDFYIKSHLQEFRKRSGIKRINKYSESLE